MKRVLIAASALMLLGCYAMVPPKFTGDGSTSVYQGFSVETFRAGPDVYSRVTSTHGPTSASTMNRALLEGTRLNLDPGCKIDAASARSAGNQMSASLICE